MITKLLLTVFIGVFMQAKEFKTNLKEIYKSAMAKMIENIFQACSFKSYFAYQKNISELEKKIISYLK